MTTKSALLILSLFALKICLTLLENSYRPIWGLYFSTMVSPFFVNKKKRQIKVRELARTHLHHAIFSHDEVRHTRPKFDTCRKVFFWWPCNVKIEFFTLSFHRPEFYTHLQKIEGGSLKKILEKKNVFPKKYVELRTFDGTYCTYSVTSTHYLHHVTGLIKIDKKSI